jgi:hypothetical protein
MFRSHLTIRCIVVGVLFFWSCQAAMDVNAGGNNETTPSSQIIASEAADSSETMNDSLIIIPLDQVYNKEVRAMISNQEYNEAATKMVMAFCLAEDKILFANNNRQVFQWYDPATKKITKAFSYPVMPDYENPIERMFIKEDILYCTGYSNTYEMKVSSGATVSISNPAFGRTGFETIPVFSKNGFMGLVDFPERNTISVDGPGLDLVFSKNARAVHGVLKDGKSLRVIFNEKQQEIGASTLLANRKLSSYHAIDIVYDDGQKLLFVLKSNMTEEEPDLLMTYDLLNNALMSCREVKSHIPGIESQLGDPICFSTGTNYLLSDDNVLWRLRTTVKGVMLEKWRIDV